MRFLELEGPILARITADKNLGRVEGCQNIYLSLFRLVHQEILIPTFFDDRFEVSNDDPYANNDSSNKIFV